MKAWTKRIGASTFVLAAASSSFALILRGPIAALPGDYPDPSVVRVGDDYWASATSSEWAPEFPLLRSEDLVHWKIAGAVFQERPAWAEGSFWAPEISEDRGRFSVFYSARKKDGPLCVAVATASAPSGPYVDRGPLVCEDVGSIDPAPVTDENGDRYLVWKSDGNSAGRPTPILAQRLADDGLALVGERFELIRNDARWEGALVEGPFVLRRDGWFYLFYSGSSCCELRCDYAVGVARSRNLLGPWEKNPRNPILAGNESWRCPGHGSVVSDPSGRTFFVYHAMGERDSVYVGRQLLTDEIDWNGDDGWPSINGGNGPANALSSAWGPDERAAARSFEDDFSAPALDPGWQWPQDNEPSKSVASGFLLLGPSAGNLGHPLGAVLARSSMSADYEASTRVDLASLPSGLAAGLAAYGSADQALGLSIGDGEITLWQRMGTRRRIYQKIAAPPSASIDMTMTVRGGSRFSFSAKVDGRELLRPHAPLDGRTLPPWDLGIRVALISGGTKGHARFKWFKIRPNGDRPARPGGPPTS